MMSATNTLYYIYSIFKKGVKPHLFTWLTWSLITAIAAAGQYVGGAGFGFLVVAWYSFATGVIALLSLKYGEKHITKSDYIALGFCLVAIVLWQLTKTPLYSVIIVSIIDIVAIYPTLRKSFSKPMEENLFSFLLFGSTTALSLLALSEYNILTLLYPITIIFADLLIAGMLIIRRKQLGYKVLVCLKILIINGSSRVSLRSFPLAQLFTTSKA